MVNSTYTFSSVISDKGKIEDNILKCFNCLENGHVYALELFISTNQVRFLPDTSLLSRPHGKQGGNIFSNLSQKKCFHLSLMSKVVLNLVLVSKHIE